MITGTMIDNIENKIESLHLQEWSLKNRSPWKLVISLEASFFNLHASIDIFSYHGLYY